MIFRQVTVDRIDGFAKPLFVHSCGHAVSTHSCSGMHSRFERLLQTPLVRMQTLPPHTLVASQTPRRDAPESQLYATNAIAQRTHAGNASVHRPADLSGLSGVSSVSDIVIRQE